MNPKSLSSVPANSATVFADRPEQLARPFLKWVGGKTQLIKALDANLPNELKSGKLKTYIEPFVGGGAFFFHIAQRYPVEKFLLADTNTDLILTYWIIREQVGQLITALHDLQTKYFKLDENKREVFYYKIRSRFNSQKSSIEPSRYSEKWIERCSHLIFLNKTGFNGLYRVNSAGKYNVAFGKYKNPKICDPDNLIRVSNVLRKSEIYLCDFEEILDYVDSKSLVYIDPPYRPLSDTAYFTSYSPNTFTALDQQRLANFCKKIDKKKAKLLISNSDPSNVDPKDTFFQQNYPNFNIVRTAANRMINCKADRRGKINELIIMNYENEQRSNS